MRSDGEGEVRLTPEQERLVEQNMPLVHHIVSRVTERFPSGFSRDDLVQAGSLGLIEATRRFDPDRGFAFSTFAGRRIEGAVLDSLRSADWASRSVRQGERELRTAHTALAASLGRQPTTDELARAMGVDEQQLNRLQADLARARLDSLNQRTTTDDGEGREHEIPVDGDDDALERQELLGYLRDAVHLLPERHRLIVVGYFLEGRTMTELGEFLGITQSRASQIKGEALGMMKEGLTSAMSDVTDTGEASRTGKTKAQAEYNRSLRSASTWRERLIATG